MKPFGRVKKINFPSKQDYIHGRLKKEGHINWWEEMNTTVSRGSLNHKIRQYIKNII